MTDSKQPSEQFKAFRSRLMANLPTHEVGMFPEEMQYWIERPHLIPCALAKCFRPFIICSEAWARRRIEQRVWGARVHMFQSTRYDSEAVDKCKKLVVWFLRQSKLLSEEIVLYSPYDPDDQTEQSIVFAQEVHLFIEDLNSSSSSEIEMSVVLRGFGSPLYFSSCVDNEGRVLRMFLTVRHNHPPKTVRRLKWIDAMNALETISRP